MNDNTICSEFFLFRKSLKKISATKYYIYNIHILFSIDIFFYTIVNKLLECSPDQVVHWFKYGLNMGYLVANFLVPQIPALDDAEKQLFVVNDELGGRSC